MAVLVREHSRPTSIPASYDTISTTDHTSFPLIPDVNSISADGVGFVFFYIQFTGAILEAFFCLGVGNGNKMYLGDSFSSAASSID